MALWNFFTIASITNENKTHQSKTQNKSSTLFRRHVWFYKTTKEFRVSEKIGDEAASDDDDDGSCVFILASPVTIYRYCYCVIHSGLQKLDEGLGPCYTNGMLMQTGVTGYFLLINAIEEELRSLPSKSFGGTGAQDRILKVSSQKK